MECRHPIRDAVELIPFPVNDVMSKIEVFDRAMCCSTGVCGPQIDPVLPRFAADLAWLADLGHEVTRYNLAQQPTEFVNQPLIAELLSQAGAEALPAVLIDGRIVSQGTYPERAEFLGWVDPTAPATSPAKPRSFGLPVTLPSQSGCSGDDCC